MLLQHKLSVRPEKKVRCDISTVSRRAGIVVLSYVGHRPFFCFEDTAVHGCE